VAVGRAELQFVRSRYGGKRWLCWSGCSWVDAIQC